MLMYGCRGGGGVKPGGGVVNTYDNIDDAQGWA